MALGRRRTVVLLPRRRVVGCKVGAGGFGGGSASPSLNNCTKPAFRIRDLQTVLPVLKTRSRSLARSRRVTNLHNFCCVKLPRWRYNIFLLIPFLRLAAYCLLAYIMPTSFALACYVPCRCNEIFGRYASSRLLLERID